MENKSDSILSALSPTMSMNAILLQPNSIDQVFGDATLGEHDQANSVHVAPEVCGLKTAELNANTTHDNGEEGTNTEQHEYRPRRSSHARRRPLRFSSSSPLTDQSSRGRVTADKNQNSSGVSQTPRPTEISTSLADCVSDAGKSACDLDAGYREWRLEAFLKCIQIGSQSTYSIEFGVDNSHPLASSLHSQLVLPRNLHPNPPIDDEKTIQSIDYSNVIERPSMCNLPKKSDPSIDRAPQRRGRARKRSSTISVIAKKQLAAPPKHGERKRKKAK